MRRSKPPRRTIADELDWGVRKLARAGKPRPQSLALTTWAVCSDARPGAVWLDRLSSPSEDLVRGYRRAIGEQVAGAPFQLAVGVGAFRMLELRVDRNVLIPRVETEVLVDHVLAWCAEHGWGTAADVGTGSGALALSLALEGRFDRVIATDVSPPALAVARRNLEAIRPRTPVEFRAGSLLAPFADRELTVLVSNPPYLTTGEFEQLAPEVRDYEPRLAFDGGADGLDPFREILSGGDRVLQSGGLLALEIDSRRPEAVRALALAAGWSGVRVVADVFERPRYLLATKPRTT